MSSDGLCDPLKDKIGEATTHNSQKTTLEIENKIGEETQTTHESSQKEIHGVQEYMDTGKHLESR